MSGARKDRPELQKALEELRQGDTLVVWKLDRLGRTVKQLLDLIEDLKIQRINFKSIKDKIDTTTPTGTFFFHVMASFSQLERELMLERTMAGLKIARSRGKYGGLPNIHSKRKKEVAYDMYLKNDKTVQEIANDLGMGRVTIYRYINKKRSEIDTSKKIPEKP